MSVSCVSKFTGEDNVDLTGVQFSNDAAKTILNFIKIKNWKINDKQLDLYFNNKEFQVCIKESNTKQIHIFETMNCLQNIEGIPKNLKNMDIQRVFAFFSNTYVTLHPFGKNYKVSIYQQGKGGMTNGDEEECNKNLCVSRETENMLSSSMAEKMVLQDCQNTFSVNIALLLKKPLDEIMILQKSLSEKREKEECILYEELGKATSDYRKFVNDVFMQVLKDHSDEKMDMHKLNLEILLDSQEFFLKAPLDQLCKKLQQIQDSRQVIVSQSIEQYYKLIDKIFEVKEKLLKQTTQVRAKMCELEIQREERIQKIKQKEIEVETKRQEIIMEKFKEIIQQHHNRVERLSINNPSSDISSIDPALDIVRGKIIPGSIEIQKKWPKMYVWKVLTMSF